MLEPIEGLPDDVVGFVAKGELHSADYEEQLIPAVERALEEHDKIRLLYVLGEGFDGISTGAAWDDTKVGFAHITRWEKIAVVTDEDWIRHSVDVFGYLMPGDVKGFPLAELDQAKAWVVA